MPGTPAAETSRGFGGIIHYQISFASGYFEEMAAKQRAGRWRAAVPLHGNWNYKIRVKGTVIDIHGVDWVSVKVSGQSTKKVNLHDEKLGTFDKSYNVDWGRSIGGGYDIKVKAGDVNGNVAKYKTHMDGVLEAFVNLVMKLLTALLEAIIALLTMFIDWIWNAIRGMMDYVFKPIKDGIKSYVKGVGSAIGNEYSTNPNGDSTSSADKIGKAIFGPLWNVFKILGEIINAVVSLIKPFLDLVSGLIKDVGKFVGNIIKGAMGISGGRKKDTENSLLSFLSGGSESLINGIGSMINTKSLEEDIPGEYPEANWATTCGFIKAIFVGIFCTLAFFDITTGGFWKLFTACTLVIWGCILYLFKDEIDSGLEKVGVALASLYMSGIAFALALSTTIKGSGPITKLFGAILTIIGGFQLYFIAKYLNDLKPSKVFFGD